MIDLVKLYLSAGDGGNGRVAFRREKYVPKGGPSGGNGGDGGHIIIKGVKDRSSLVHLSGVKEYRADSGQAGGKQKRKGFRGKDIVIEVPIGTRVWLLAENQVSKRRRERYSLDYFLNRDEVDIKKFYLKAEGQAVPLKKEDELEPILKFDQEADFNQLPKQQLLEVTASGQEIMLCQGGFGGRGNNTFKGPANTTPLEAERGSAGEKKIVVFEQLLLADIGLVGFPNAGKSTLISVLTKARPKVADYPFTTLEPNLGVLPLKGREVVIADIPGLIEGASQGKGLGHAFLRHIEHCRLLLFVLYLSEEIIFDEKLSVKKRADYLYQQFLKLQKELDDYGQELKTKSFLVGINKQDLYSEELVIAIKKLFALHKQEIIIFSAATKSGIDKLLDAFSGLLG
ncbi:MAG: GTPase ObgE [Patescibacteria group bacterium]